jgi:hypothetical protein
MKLEKCLDVIWFFSTGDLEEFSRKLKYSTYPKKYNLLLNIKKQMFAEFFKNIPKYFFPITPQIDLFYVAY